jgi:hypothetical protein
MGSDATPGGSVYPWKGVLLVFVWLGAFGASDTARAQIPVHVEITPQLGYFFFNGDASRDLEVNDDGVLYQFRFGIVFPANWGFEGAFGIVWSDFPRPGPEHEERSFYISGSAVYHFENASRFTPLLAAGVENLDMDTSAGGNQGNVALVWGPGLKFELSSHAALRVDGRHHFNSVSDLRDPAEPDLWLNHLEVAAGFTWRPWE